MKATYRVLGYLISTIVALQASFIALGVFGLGKYVGDGHTFTKNILENGGATGDVGFALHSFGAMAAALVAIVLLVVSFFAKIEGGVRVALFVFLDVVLQWVLAFLSFAAWAVGILHGLNAFVLFGLGMMAAGVATRSMKHAEAPGTPAASAV